jgi:hypothetical protein
MDASEAAHVREMMVGMTVGTVRITEISIKKPDIVKQSYGLNI